MGDGLHLWSSNVITDRNGQFHEHLEYFPYGETWVREKASSGAEYMAHLFTGKEFDPETGLYDHGARYRDPKLGGWLSVDPALARGEYFPSGNRERDSNLPGMGGVFNPVNLNVYCYAGLNPVKFVDPDGNYSIFVELPDDRNHTGKLHLYDDSGKHLSSYNVLGRGSNDALNNYTHNNRLKPHADTPTGIFEIRGRGEFKENDKQRYNRYGPIFLLLKGIFGEAEKSNKERSGIGVHGGKARQRPGIDVKEEGSSLWYTWGCLRISDKDATDINTKIKEIEKGRGHTSGQDPKGRDTVHVFDGYKKEGK